MVAKIIEKIIQSKQTIVLDRADRETILELQTLLNRKGFNAGAADGVAGKQTLNAWARFKKSQFLDQPLLLGAASLQALIDAPDRSGHFLPTNGTGWLSSPFGPRGRGFHKGVDIAVPVGTPVFAVANGRVVIAVSGCSVGDISCGGGYGNVVYLDHGEGITTRYGHLSIVNVVPGEVVTAGTLLGYSGNSGHSFGPHLHFEWREGGEAIDPLTRINPIF